MDTQGKRLYLASDIWYNDSVNVTLWVSETGIRSLYRMSLIVAMISEVDIGHNHELALSTHCRRRNHYAGQHCQVEKSG